MKRSLLVVLVLAFMVSCSPHRKIQKSFTGESIEALEAELGKPVTVFDKENGKEYIFEKVVYLNSAEISQHKLTLDPMVTPKVTKTTRYYVWVEDGVIAKIKVEDEYER